MGGIPPFVNNSVRADRTNAMCPTFRLRLNGGTNRRNPNETRPRRNSFHRMWRWVMGVGSVATTPRVQRNGYLLNGKVSLLLRMVNLRALLLSGRGVD